MIMFYILAIIPLIYEGTIIAVDSKHVIVLTGKTFKLVISLYDGYYKVIKGIKMPKLTLIRGLPDQVKPL